MIVGRRTRLAVTLIFLFVSFGGTRVSIAQNSENDPSIEGPTAPSADKGFESAPEDAMLSFELPAIPEGVSVSLAEAIRKADERNLSLEAIRMEIERADSELYRSWAALLPVANGTMTYSHLDHAETANLGGTSITTRHQDNLSGAIEVSVPVIKPQTWAGIGVSRINSNIAELNVESSRQALLLTVAQSYYQALTARNLIDTQLGQVRSAARYLEISKSRLASGVGQRVDVIRAKSDLVRLQEQLISAHSTLAKARDTLGKLTGMGGMPIPMETREASPPSGEEEELVETGLKNREDLKRKEAMVELSGSQLKVSWMQFIPSLNASWQLTHQFTQTGAMGDSDRTRWTAYLVLSVPLYSQTRYADLDVQRAAIRKAELEAQDAAESASLEIRNVRRDYLTAMQRIETAAQQAELAKETLLLVETEYRVGTGTSLAVTDARRSSSEAEINLASRRLEAQNALLSLIRAVGGDMKSLAE